MKEIVHLAVFLLFLVLLIPSAQATDQVLAHMELTGLSWYMVAAPIWLAIAGACAAILGTLGVIGIAIGLRVLS